MIGDGAVGLSAVISAKLMGASRIILMGRHKARTDLGREFGATDVVAERGEEGIAKVRNSRTATERTWCSKPWASGRRSKWRLAWCATAASSAVWCAPVLRRSARIPRVPAQHHPHRRRRTARAYIEELLPLVLDGTIDPGKVFDRTIGLDDVPAGYQAMADREALKVLVRP